VVDFHVNAYTYYRKHLQQFALSPMHAVVLGGLFARFLVALTVQSCAEAGGLLRSGLMRRKPVQ